MDAFPLHPPKLVLRWYFHYEVWTRRTRSGFLVNG
jgi:hypothetical protein